MHTNVATSTKLNCFCIWILKIVLFSKQSSDYFLVLVPILLETRT